MTLPILYLTLCATLIYVMARLTRDGSKLWQLRACIGIMAGYTVVCLILWMMVINETGIDKTWVVALPIVLIPVAIGGLTYQPSEAHSPRWHTVARLRRTYRSLLG